MTHAEKQNTWIEMIPEEDQMPVLLDKDFRATFLKMLKGLQEDMDKSGKAMYVQYRNINKQKAWKEQKQMLKLKSITEMKNPLKGFKSRFEQAKERINRLEERAIETIRSEEQKEKRLKKWE